MEEESKAKLENLKKLIPKIQEDALQDYYKMFYKKWLYFLVCLAFGLIAGYFVSLGLPSNFISVSNTASDIAKTLIAPSITINGLFVTFLPIIGFFYISDIKESQKEDEAAFREDTKEFKAEEDLKTVNSALVFRHTYWYNLRVGVLKYVRLHVVISLFSLIILIFAYIVLSPKTFVAVDIFLLLSILSGIFPIILAALTKPTLVLYTVIKLPIPKGNNQKN